MPMNSPFVHCMWSDQKSWLSLTHACEIVFVYQGWTLLGPVLVPCGLVDHLYLSWTRG